MSFTDTRNVRKGTHFERAMERCRTRTWVEDMVVRRGACRGVAGQLPSGDSREIRVGASARGGAGESGWSRLRFSATLNGMILDE